MEYAYWSLGEERICKIWHSLLPYAKPLGYKQLFLDKLDCESKEWFLDIVDIDNVNQPNMTRFHENYRSNGNGWKVEYKKRRTGDKINQSIENWGFEWKSVEQFM